MKTKCPVCKTEIEFDSNDFDEGDIISCEECEEDLIVEIKGGSYRLVTDKQKKFEEMEELEDELCVDEE